MRVQIVIPVINLWKKFTKQCIDSVVKACEGVDYRILLIDNASIDETKDEAGKLVSSTFSHKRNEERWGCGQSWNYGIKDGFERGFDYIFVVNNDTLLHQDAIKNLMSRFEKDDIVMATCMNIKGECSTPEDIFNKKSIDKEKVEESEHPDFSGFMINKKFYEMIGESDMGFFPAYYEDNDIHRRIKLAGLKAIVLPTAMFYHYGSQTQLQAINRPLVDSSISHSYFIAKWGGNPEPDGILGNRLWMTPFNDSKKTIKWTLQDACICKCDVKCQGIIEAYKKY